MTAVPTPRNNVPPLIVAACVVSIVAFYLASGGSVLLPIFALSIVASQFVRARVNNLSPAGLVLRLAAIGSVVIANGGRDTKLMDAFVFAPVLDFVTHCLAAEMAVEPWLTWPPGRGRALVFFSALVFFGGCATGEPRAMVVLAPLYFYCLILGMRQFTNAKRGAGPIGRLFVGYAGLILVLGAGAIAQFEFQIHKDDITNFGLEHFGNVAPAKDGPSDGIDKDPQLTSSFDVPGSSSRILRIDGPIDDPHLHGMSYGTYSLGHWKPDLTTREFEPASPSYVRGKAAGRSVNVIRFVTDDGMVSAPLACAGLRLPVLASDMSIDTDRSSVRAGDAPYQYAIVDSGSAIYQGPLAGNLLPPDRRRYLDVPHEIDGALIALAHKIAPSSTRPMDRVAAIVAFLGRNNSYSLKANVGTGDPVSTFVLKRRPGHCQYFGSAAAIMLRIAKIPTRYVIGYYAHETNSGGGLVVRGQDAHAWCEAWIDGTGWVTVDATPADGRPDHTAQRSALWRLSDRLQDLVAWWELKVRAAGTAGRVVAIVLIVTITAGYFIVQAVLARRRKPVEASYAPSDRELAELAARFESLLMRRGVECPPSTPWTEHVARLGDDKIDRNTARRFVNDYAAARFGNARRDAAMQLSAILGELEQEHNEQRLHGHIG